MSLSKMILFFCHELSLRARHVLPENALQHDDSCVVNFGVKLKIALTSVRSRVREYLAKQLI